MKRSQLNAGLIALVLLLAIIVFASQKKDDKKPPLTSLKPSKVESIVIEHPGAAAIRLSKQNDVWKLTAPVEAEVDPFEISALVGLADTGVQDKISGAKLRELRLDPPAYRITLNDRRIDFGGEEPLKYRRYVRVGKDEPVVINDPASPAFDKDYSDLVAKNLLPSGADITRISAPGLSIEKTAGGGWSSPDHPQAKTEQLLAVVAAWKNAKSMWNAAIVPGDDKAEAITLTLSDGRTIGLTLIAREPQLLLASPTLGLRYTLAKTEVDTLLNLVPAPVAAVAPVAAPPSPQPTATPPAASSTP